jgi:hypothetical protein
VWKVGVAASLLAEIAISRSAWAGPPFITDDPEPVALHHWEFYIAGQYSHDRDGNSAAVPQFELNYGAFPNTQLHLVAPLAYSDPKDGDSHYGYGDTELGVKYRFVEESDRVPQIGAFPLIELPTGDHDKDLGNGKAQVFLPIWLQKSWGKWTSYGGGGWWYNPGDGNRNFWRFGCELQREVIDEKLVLGGELVYQTADTKDGDDSLGFNLGGIWNVDEHKHILFSAGRDFDGPNLFRCYVGLQFTF